MNNKAGYTAAQIACGQGRAVIEMANQVFMQKSPINAKESKYDRMTDRHSGL